MKGKEKVQYLYCISLYKLYLYVKEKKDYENEDCKVELDPLSTSLCFLSHRCCFFLGHSLFLDWSSSSAQVFDLCQ